MRIEGKWLGKGHKRKMPCRVDILVESVKNDVAGLLMEMVIPGSEQLVPANRFQLRAGGKFSISSLYTEAEVSSGKPSETKSSPSDNGKLKFGEFFNVLLTAEEFTKLQDKFGDGKAKDLIERLSAYIASSKKGRKYVSHYATLLNWERRDKEKAVSGTNRNPRSLPTTYTRGPDYQD